MKVICKQYKDGKKCPECNWSAFVKYGTDKKKIDKEGLCASCFMQMLYLERWDILPAK